MKMIHALKKFRLGSDRYRIMLLASSFMVMAIIGIYQYSWFLFSFQIEEQLGWDLAALGLVYTVFHYTFTLITPFSGYIADHYGPRYMSSLAAVLAGAGFVLCGYFPQQWPFLVFYGLGGIGCGILYGISTATAVKWFPHRRGLATGLTVFGFGAGTAVFNVGIEEALEAFGLRATFLGVGILMLLIHIPLAQVYRYPHDETKLQPRKLGRPTKPPTVDFKPQEMLKTYQWYVIYFSFSFTISAVVILASQLKTLASHYQLPAGYLRALLILFPVANGLSRVLAGAASDRLGRSKTLQFFYSLLGLSTLGLVWFGGIPSLFFFFVILVALFGGSPIALYPVTIGDFYGPKYFTTNYGITYTAKAWAGLVSGWLSGYLVSRFGSFTLPLLAIGVLSIVAAMSSHPTLLTPPQKGASGRSGELGEGPMTISGKRFPVARLLRARGIKNVNGAK